MPIDLIQEHLNRSILLLSDKKAPDYRNSIKESISAVEAMCRLITNSKSATLGEALDKIEKDGRVEIRPVLKEAFKKLYGYTSAENGIRHALTENTIVSSDEARFMLLAQPSSII